MHWQKPNSLSLAPCAHFSTGHRLASDKAPRTQQLQPPEIELQSFYGIKK